MVPRTRRCDLQIATVFSLLVSTTNAFLPPPSSFTKSRAQVTTSSSLRLPHQQHTIALPHIIGMSVSPDSSSSSRSQRQRETETESEEVLSSRDDQSGLDDPIVLPEIEAPPLNMTPEQRITLWTEIKALEPKLQAALDVQDFSTAAEIRERLAFLKAKDPYFALREALDNAIVREEYFSAARLKQQLDRLGTPPGLASVGRPSPAAAAVQAAAEAAAAAQSPKKFVNKQQQKLIYSSRSDTTTNGIRVEVRSQYYPEQSNPLKDQYIFIYKVKITNNCPNTVQLVSRKWEIRTVGSGGGKPKTQEVKGPGVVGQQPVLEPGESFDTAPLVQSLRPP